jgi:hypothetical protein
VVLDSRLKDSVERDEPDKCQRHQQGEPERIERGSYACRGGDQPERHRAARDGRQEHVGAAGRLGDRGRTSSLEDEVLTLYQ